MCTGQFIQKTGQILNISSAEFELGADEGV